MKDKTFILLLPSEKPSDTIPPSWLADLGLKAWKAHDLQHVFEELSDFTVQDRPDVILLEVQSLSVKFDEVQTSIREFSGSTPVAVAAYCDADEPRSESRFFTNDLSKLACLIGEETGKIAQKHG